MRETMRHIDKIIIKQASGSRAASSCSSDVDRRELIHNYGSEKYLSKWSLEGQDSGATPDSNIKTTDEQTPEEIPSNDKEQHHLPIDEDAASLVSYNSVRDCTRSKNTTTSYLPYQIQTPKEDITLWQGYSGNIYFDPVKCRSVRINSSKPTRRKPKEKSSTHRLTKSCSPAAEIHALSDSHFISYSSISFHSLGSLRFGSREETKKHAVRTHCQYGRLRKGFIDGREKKESGRNRSESTPDSLVIAGGQVSGKTDPIDSVYRHNTKTRSSSNGRRPNVTDYQSFPSLIVGRKWDKVDKCGDNRSDPQDQQTRLPQVDQTTVNSKDVSEPTPVFIIPFATLDDPVEPDSNKQGRRESSKNETPITKPHKDDLNRVEEAAPSNKTVPPVVKHVEKPKEESEIQPTTSQSIAAHIINITGEDNKNTAVSPRNTTEFQVRREISNSSLSNYLRAVPTHYSNTYLPKEQKKVVPKLTYTQRTMELRPVDLSLEGNDMYIDRSIGMPRTTALYGGYLPSTTRATNTQNFKAQISSDENDSVTSPPREEKRHVTHGHLTKSCIKRTGLHVTDKQLPANEKCHLPVIGWHVS